MKKLSSRLVWTIFNICCNSVKCSRWAMGLIHSSCRRVNVSPFSSIGTKCMDEWMIFQLYTTLRRHWPLPSIYCIQNIEGIARTRLPVYTSCSSRSALLRSLCSSTKFMRRHRVRVTWVRSSVCPIYCVGVVSALPALIAWSCHHLNCPCTIDSRNIESCCCSELRHGTVWRRTVYNIVTNVAYVCIYIYIATDMKLI